MSRISIPLEALTSRFNLGSRFDGVRSQSLTARFSNLKPVGEFMDLKRLSKPANFSEVQSRVNYNLSYFQSNYFAVACMLGIYSLLTNLKLLFDMVFMAAGLFAIRKLDGRDLQLGFTTLTPSQLYTILFFRGGGLGGRPRAPKDLPFWGRPSGARQGQQRYFGGNIFLADEKRFEELSSSTDEDEKQLYNASYSSTNTHYLAGNLGGKRKNAREFTFSESETDTNGTSEEDAAFHSDNVKSRDLQLYLRDKEGLLVTQALQRIRRAQKLGKTNVKLSELELKALQRSRQSEEEYQVESSDNDYLQKVSRSQGRKSSKVDRMPSSQQSYRSPNIISNDERSASVRPLSRRPPKKQILSPDNNESVRPTAIETGHTRPSRRGPSHRGVITSSSRRDSHSIKARSNASSRALPDDPSWVPRPRSTSSISTVPYHDDSRHRRHRDHASPPLPAMPVRYASQARRIVSNPHPSSRAERSTLRPDARAAGAREQVKVVSDSEADSSDMSSDLSEGSTQDSDDNDDDDNEEDDHDVHDSDKGVPIDIVTASSPRIRNADDTVGGKTEPRGRRRRYRS